MWGRFISNEALYTLLSKATLEERRILSRALGHDQLPPLSAEKLVEEASSTGGHSVINLVRQRGTGYIDILDDIAGEMGIKDLPRYDDLFKERFPVKELDQLEHVPTKSDTIKRYKKNGWRVTPYSEREKQALRRAGNEYCALAEQKILLKVGEHMRAAYEKMSDADKAAFDDKVKKIAAEHGESWKALKVTGGAFLIASFGGFAPYMLMSSVLHAISFGTLSFGAYTAASSLLHVLLGPVGWAALGAAVVHKASKGNLKKTIPFALAVSAVRQRVSSEDFRKEFPLRAH